MFYRYFAKTFAVLFDIIEHDFWKINIIPEEEEKYKKWLKFINRVIKSIRISYIVMNFFYTIEPLFYQKRMMRMTIWLPYKDMIITTPFYQIFYLLECFLTMSCYFAILHFDLIIVLLLGAAYIQLEMIKYYLLKINDNLNKYETVKKCIQHQNLIFW